MTARRLGEVDDGEFGLADEEYERGALIELAAGGRRRTAPPAAGGEGGGGSSVTCRWAAVLFLLALAGVYHLGLQEGKNEVRGEAAAGVVDRPHDARARRRRRGTARTGRTGATARTRTRTRHQARRRPSRPRRRPRLGPPGPSRPPSSRRCAGSARG